MFFNFYLVIFTLKDFCIFNKFNIDLQIFIENEIKKFVIGSSSSMMCESLDNIQRTDIILYNKIQTDESTLLNEFFRILSELFPHVETIVNYKSCLISIIDALKIYTETSQYKKITLISYIYCLLKEDNLNHEILVGHSRTDFFTKLKLMFETLFNKYFTIIESAASYEYY
jgi:hypothetical protein